MKRIYIFLLLFSILYNNCLATHETSLVEEYNLHHSISSYKQSHKIVHLPWQHNENLGHILNSENDILQVTPLPSHQGIPKFLLFQELDNNPQPLAVMDQEIIEKKTDKVRSRVSKFIATKGIKVIAIEDFNSINDIFRTDKNIEFSAPRFDFTGTFFDIIPEISTIKLASTLPDSTLEYILLTPPKREIQRPICITGEVDFSAPTFIDFSVSHADIYLKFR